MSGRSDDPKEGDLEQTQQLPEADERLAALLARAKRMEAADATAGDTVKLTEDRFEGTRAMSAEEQAAPDDPLPFREGPAAVPPPEGSAPRKTAAAHADGRFEQTAAADRADPEAGLPPYVAAEQRAAREAEADASREADRERRGREAEQERARQRELERLREQKRQAEREAEERRTAERERFEAEQREARAQEQRQRERQRKAEHRKETKQAVLRGLKRKG